VLQETADELLGWEGAGFPGASGAVTVAEGDLTVLKVEDPPIGEGDAKDIGRQIFEGGFTDSDRLAVNDPLLSPDLGRNLPGQPRLLQSSAELGSKEAGQGFDVNEEGIAGTPPGQSVSGQTVAGDDGMDVGMVSDVAGPGLQHPQETRLPADKARIVRQLFSAADV
jgi:hypothetical protein